jgi:hypothetical protein
MTKVEVSDGRSGAFIISDKRALKKLRETFKNSPVARHKWKQLKTLNDAQVGERADFVVLRWDEHERPEDSEVVFVKYREKLGPYASVFIQPVFAVRLGKNDDRDLETWAGVTANVLDRVTDFQTIVTATEGLELRVQLTGPSKLVADLETVLMMGTSILSGVPVFLNGVKMDRMLDNIETSNVVPNAEHNIGFAFQWPDNEFEEEEADRLALRVAPKDAWASTGIETIGDFSVSPASDDLVSQVGRNQRDMKMELGIENFIKLHMIGNEMSLFGAWRSENDMTLVSFGLSVEFADANPEAWHLGVEINLNMIPTGNASAQAAAAIAICLKKQFEASLRELIASVLERTQTVKLDFIAAYGATHRGEGYEFILEAIEDVLRELTDAIENVTFGRIVIFAFDEEGFKDQLEDQGVEIPGRLPRGRLRRHGQVATDDAETRIAEEVRRNLLGQLNL